MRENLWWALFYLRHASAARVLWVDAICIDQNQILERNAQVKQMGRVYSQAESVLVWLGRPDNESAGALQFLDQLASHLEIHGEDPEYIQQCDPN